MVHTDGTPTIACGAELNERLNLTPFDFVVRDEGTIVLLAPQNDAAREWIDEHLYGDGGAPVQWWGGSVAIDHGLADSILTGIISEGLTIA